MCLYNPVFRSKMKLALVIAAVCLVTLGECKWREGQGRRETANEIRPSPYYNDPPDHTKIIPMARYVLHNSGRYRLKYCTCAFTSYFLFTN